jgi:hypothetical protein
MIFEKEILSWNGNNGLSKELIDVISLPKTDFPKLIFQDFLNQLKIPKIQIGFEFNTNKLLEVDPIQLEQFESSSVLGIDKINSINKMDFFSYYLLTQILQTDFKINNIYTNNNTLSKLYFESLIPFSKNIRSESEDDSLEHIKMFISRNKKKDLQNIRERFFILLGNQYKDKLTLFLTYLDTKYNFKMDKTSFVEATLGCACFERVSLKTNHLFNEYA